MLKNINGETSNQEGGIGRYTLPLCTTKRKTTHSKSKNNQNCQEIKVYRSPTTKELKKNHLFRLVGGAEMDSWAREDTWQGGIWRNGWVRWQLEDQGRQDSSWQNTWSHICMLTNREDQLGRKTVQPRVPLWEKTASKPLAVKTSGGCGGRNSQPHRRVHWRDPQGPRMYTKPPTEESAA